MFLQGFLVGLLFTILVTGLTFSYRKADVEKVVSTVKRNLPKEKGGFIESDQTLKEKHDEIWS